MSEFKNKQFVTHFLLLVAFACVAMMSAFIYGITSGNDLFQHYQFALTIKESISSGEIYTSFAASLNHGFGDVGLRFYPPLSYYALNFFHFLTGEWYFASQLQFFLVFLLSGLGTYLWSKEEFSPNQALIAAAIYIFAPHHLNQIYNNFLFAEFNATAVIPFCFLFVTRVCRKNDRLDIFGLAIAYAFLILTHLPLTIICSVVLGIYALIILPREKFFTTLFKLSAAVISALALTAFYWSRLIAEMNWVKHSTPKYFSGTWDYQTNFLFQIENIVNFQDDVLNLWLADLMLLSMVLISIPSFILLIKNKFAVSKLVWAVFAVLVFAIFMTTPLSDFVWVNLPFLQKVQFPWRWLGIVSLFGAIFSSIGIGQLSETLKKSRNILLPIGVGAIFLVFIFTSSFIVKGAVYNSRQDFNRQLDTLNEAESFECWWTIWAEKSAFNQKEKVAVQNRAVKIQTWNATKRILTVSAGGAQPISLATFYYPHWKAKVNGIETEVDKTVDGKILIPVSEAESVIELKFVEPFLVKICTVLSIVTWLTGLGLLLLNLFYRARLKTSQP
jgi:hypothetical protein